jgi:hypothetical protein
MKLHAIRSVSAIALAVLLAACGGGQADQSADLAVAMQSGSGAQPGSPAGGQVGAQVGAQASAQTAAPASAPAVAQVAANMPLPDCAAEGCRGLRIIDGNAEAYRYEAMRRAAAGGTSI